MTACAGTLLASARRQRHLTQWQAAKAAGITPAFLSKLETGAESVPPATARRLVPVLGLKAADLLQAPRREAPRRPARPLPAVVARWFRDIPGTCPCGWAMTFTGRRPSGWALAVAKKECAHHKAPRAEEAA